MGKPLVKLSDKQIKDAVAKRYGDVAADPDGDFNFPVGREFAEKLRAERVKRQIYDREIQNTDQAGPMSDWTNVKNYDQIYQCRLLDKKIVDIKHDTYIYNDVFVFFYFIKNEMFGIEIHNAEIAKTQKQIFEVLWKLAKK